MSKFKIGDWVKVRGSIYKLDFCDVLRFKDEDIELWQPQVNEWCWCVYIDNYDKQHRDLIKWNERMNVLDFDIVEPFIGTLPTFLQGK